MLPHKTIENGKPYTLIWIFLLIAVAKLFKHPVFAGPNITGTDAKVIGGGFGAAIGICKPEFYKGLVVL
jgi:hypothetical protein